METRKNQKISVITTIKNEEKSIGPFIDTLLKQTKPPDEIVITDGGSTDRTAEIVQSYMEEGAPVQFMVVPGNRSIGRNTAIEMAHGEIIACTDAGVKVGAEWVERITAPFEDTNVDVVGGFTAPDNHTFFESCVSVINLPEVSQINPENFLPSSRSAAYRKSAWLKSGGYPEWMNLNEDTPFNFRLVRAGCNFKFVPEAVVYWRPPGSLKAVFKQFENYARGDGQGRLYAIKYYLLQKYLIYIAGLVLLGAGFVQPVWWFILFTCMLAYFWKPWKKGFRLLKDFRALLYLPVIIVTRDLAEMKGYLKGTWERLRNPEIFDRE